MSSRAASLGDICEFRYGKALPSEKRVPGSAPVFGSNGRVGTHSEALVQGPAIVIGRKGSYGEVHFSDVPLWPIDTTYYVDRSATACDLRWLYHLLKFLPLTTLNRAAAVPGLNREDAYRIPVSVPPLSEQRRIAAILDKADALRRQRKRAIELLNSLTQSIFLEMFGDPISNPQNWPVKTIGQLDVQMTYGPRFYNEAYSDDGIRIVRITDLDESGALNFQAMPRLAMSEAEIGRHQSRAGEILFARTGATVGKMALIAEDDPPSIPGAYFIRMRFPQGITPLFAWSMLRSPSIQKMIAEGSRQSAQQNFSGPGLRRLPMIVPPTSTQVAFGDHIKRIRAVDPLRVASRQNFDALFASLQSRAFSGHL